MFELALPLKANAVGTVPVRIEVATRDRVYTRNYTCLTPSELSVTELQSVKLDKQNWLGFGSVRAAFNARSVDLSVPGVKSRQPNNEPWYKSEPSRQRIKPLPLRLR